MQPLGAVGAEGYGHGGSGWHCLAVSCSLPNSLETQLPWKTWGKFRFHRAAGGFRRVDADAPCPGT